MEFVNLVLLSWETLGTIIVLIDLLQKPQHCTSPIPYYAPFLCAFLLENGALCGICLLYCGVCELLYALNISYLNDGQLTSMQALQTHAINTMNIFWQNNSCMIVI